MVDKNTAGNIVARDEANTLPVAESPTPARMAKKARVPRLRSTLLRSIQMQKARAKSRKCIARMSAHNRYIFSDTRLEAAGATGSRRHEQTAAMN
jgi:hypothetical protein